MITGEYHQSEQRRNQYGGIVILSFGLKRMHVNPTFESANMRLWRPADPISGEPAPRRYILWPPENHD